MGVIERKYKCASYPYTEKETMWAFSKFTDANGPVMKFEEGMFRKCSCVNSEGDRKPCVPPLPGFMCQRICTKVKTKNVLYADRQQRIWVEYKNNNLKDAVQRAKEEVRNHVLCPLSFCSLSSTLNLIPFLAFCSSFSSFPSHILLTIPIFSQSPSTSSLLPLLVPLPQLLLPIERPWNI